ncbi:22170_t:CDS:2 [Cetraspora pellucida]|uniref:22170_t:CDS:1 n=1 Tax=Cetraspora pellucida TaxID=1433469 RepID=A0A9N9HY24_9GLOM|nr:22170_t:CDS:2 [Cetraspora pellucida]
MKHNRLIISNYNKVSRYVKYCIINEAISFFLILKIQDLLQD